MGDEVRVWRGWARWSDDFLARFGKTGWLFGAPQLLINKPTRNRWMISCWNAVVTKVVLLPAADYDALVEQLAEREQTQIRLVNALIMEQPSQLPCVKCNMKMSEFVIASPDWNTIIRGGGHETDEEYICVACFGKIAADRIRGLCNQLAAAKAAVLDQNERHKQAMEVLRNRIAEVERIVAHQKVITTDEY